MMNKSLVASGFALLWTSCVISVDDWGGEARFTNYQSSETVGEEQRLEANIELNIGTLEIDAGSPLNVYDLDLYYNEAAFRPDLDFRREGDVAHLDFQLKGEGRSIRKLDKTRMNLRLNPTLALRLEAQTGVGETQIDLSGMKIESLRLENGVGETTLSMLSPNSGDCDRIEVRNGVGSLEITGLGNFGFRQMQFQGGVGGAKLDFSGSWEREGEVDIAVGIGGVKILLPRNLGAEVRMSKNLLSGIDASEFRKKGNTYYSNNLDHVDKVVRFRIRTGIGGISIRWI
ncbi:MAG: hypothetical protein ACE5JX_05810 [Acidobacteriota bacterium]